MRTAKKKSKSKIREIWRFYNKGGGKPSTDIHTEYSSMDRYSRQTF